MLSMWRLALTILMVGWMAIGCGGADENSSTEATGGSSGAGGAGGTGANGGSGGADEIPATVMPDGTPVCPSGWLISPEKSEPPMCTVQASVIEDASVPDATEPPPPPPDDASPPDAAQCLDLEGIDCPQEDCTLTRYTPRPTECRWACLGRHEEMGQGAWPDGASERLVTNRCHIEIPDAG